MTMPDYLRELAAGVSNWGRWGADDRRGTLNLIDDAAIRRGMAAARQGKVFSLTYPFDEDGPQLGFIPGRINPERTMISLNHSMTGDPGDFTSSDDAVSMGVQASTHLDSLAHVGYDGLLYNGLSDTTTNVVTLLSRHAARSSLIFAGEPTKQISSIIALGTAAIASF